MVRPRLLRTHVHQEKISRRSSATNIRVAGGAAASTDAVTTKAAASAAGKFEKSTGIEEKEVRTTDFEIARAPIVPQSGDRWIFQTVNEPMLVARRAGDDNLCKIEIDAEQIAVTAQFYFYPKHIVLLDGELSGGIPLLSKLKASKAKAAIAKTLVRRQLSENLDAYNNLGGAVLACTFRLVGVADRSDV